MQKVITPTIDELRGRFHRYRYRGAIQDYEILAAAMGMTKGTLYRFAKGGPVQEHILLKVEAWCAQQEEDSAHKALIQPLTV